MPNQPVTLLDPPDRRDPKPGFSLAFLTNGAYSPEAPGGAAQGHREVIDLFTVAESLGFQRGWVRNRHFDNYLSSPLTTIAAAGQHTTRIKLGTAIIPVGYEHPIRIAEDAATVDLLIGGRLELGIATGIPSFETTFGQTDPRPFKVSAAEKVDRLLEAIAGAALDTSPDGTALTARPHVPGLRERIWYGPGGVESAAQSAGQGLDLLLSAIGPDVDLGFEGGQRAQIDAHRAAWTRTDRAPRVSAHRLFFPYVTDAQRRLYQEYADLRDREGAAASRPAGSLPPTASETRRAAAGAVRPPGLLSPVVVAEPDEIVEYLRSDVALHAADEIGIFLPPGFAHRDNLELLENIATLVAPKLGWTPEVS
jgi:alkanesulfonate monooxygenase SsuD/methylene tetrahydromethanopterin reductase-like flavin-dependent oxidoreductase (luciferase family)